MARYALVIGVSENDSESLVSIAQAQADAKAMAALLKEHGGFRVTLLTGEVSRDELTQAFKAFWQQASKAEALVFYSGHGFQVVDDFDPPEVVLAPSDCGVKLDGKRRVVAQQNGLKLNSLNRQLARAEFSNLVMLLDCCHSGFLLNEEPLKQTFQVLEGRDYMLLTACRSHETAYADGVSPYSVFTETVLAGLSEAEADEQGIVTADRLIAFVKEKLRKADQEPVSLGVGRELELVRYRAQPTPEAQLNEECPYQGLEAFTAETEQYFFGRKAEATELLRRLEQCNFVPVIGPSGMGKSSVVRAGLVPRWRRQGGEVVIMKPDEAPFVMLKQALREHWADSISTAKKRKLCKLLDKENGLATLAQELPGEGKLLLVVDQFEELFTLCRDEVCKRFIEQLVAVGLAAESRLAVVMTMRSEFVTDWLLTTEIPESINSQRLDVRPLRGPGLSDAIIQPAALQEYELGEGLLELVLADVEAEPNSLPLLEFALTELWEKRDMEQRRLTTTAYREMGGLKGALNRRAKAVYQAMGPAEQVIAKAVCLQLVRIGKGETDTRWRRTKAELLGTGRDEAERQRIRDVVDDLVQGRLLVTDEKGAEPTIDLAHEALIRRWEQFVQWRQVDRDQLRLKQRAADAYDEWKEQVKKQKGKSDDYLISKGLLGELRELDIEVRKILFGSTDLEKFFQLSDAAEQESAAKLEDALVLAKLREERTKTVNLPPARIVDQSLIAIDLVGRSVKQFGEPLQLPAEDLLKQAWSKIRERLQYMGHSESVWSVAFSPQGDRIVSCSSDSTLRLWDLEGHQLGSPFEGHAGVVWSVTFSPQGNFILSGGEDETIRLWDLEGNQLTPPFQGHSGQVLSVAFDPKGDYIISGSEDKTIRLWDLAGNQLVKPFEGHSDWVWSVAFNPQGDRIVSGSEDNTLRLWDLEGNQLGNPFEGHSSQVWSAAFSPQGNRIVSSSFDKTLRLWALEDNQLGTPFEGHSAWVVSVAFSPGGDRIVSGSEDNTIRLWDLEGNRLGHPFEGHSSQVWSVAFGPQGDRIVSGSEDNTIRLWDLEGNQLAPPFQGHSGGVLSVAFSPKGEAVISGSDDHTLRIWDLKGNELAPPFQGHSDQVLSIAFSPKGDCIVSGSEDKTIRLWDLEGNQIGNPFEGHSGKVWSVAFSPKGDCIASGSEDKTIRLWDLEGNQLGNPFEGHSGQVLSVAFSPQGNRIVSGSYDNTIRTWDLEGNQIGNPFEGHYGQVLSVAFSPQGNRIVSGSEDRTIRVWRGGTWQDWLRGCCNQLMLHSSLVAPQTEYAQRACQVCLDRVWTKAEQARFYRAQGYHLHRQGDTAAAQAKFAQAQKLDPSLEIDSQLSQ